MRELRRKLDKAQAMYEKMKTEYLHELEHARMCLEALRSVEATRRDCRCRMLAFAAGTAAGLLAGMLARFM